MHDWAHFATGVKLLDCTLRDGGYYNRWDFEPGLVGDYVDAMVRAKVDAVEIGFRNPAWAGFVGKLAYSQPEQLRDLALPGAKLGVMSDTKALLGKDGQADPRILSSLYPGKGDPASFVRLATLPKDLAAAAAAARSLADSGYDVFINLMQAGGLDRASLEGLASRLGDAPVKALYLADSFGSLYPESTRRLVREVAQVFGKPVGFHAHDNLGLANANALAAAEAGATWIDGTVMGMGRGAGNARTENLVPILKGLGRSDLMPTALGRLVEARFRPLQQRYEWGPSLAFGLAALAEIHPTYAQKLLAGGRYDSAEVLHAIEVLRGDPGRASFSEATLLKARAAANGWSTDVQPALPASLAGDRSKPCLVLGAGPSLARYADGIRAVAQRCGLVVLTNAVSGPAAPHAVRMAIHRRQARPVSESKDQLPVIHPFPADEARQLFPGRPAHAVACALGDPQPGAAPLRIPSDVVGMYAIEWARSAGYGHILLAGFDGYGALGSIEKDPDAMTREALLTAEMNGYFEAVARGPDPPRIESITPTWYNVKVVSAYEPR